MVIAVMLVVLDQEATSAGEFHTTAVLMSTWSRCANAGDVNDSKPKMRRARFITEFSLH